MESNVKQLVNYILSGEKHLAKVEFENILNKKITNALADKKILIAKSIFNSEKEK